MGATLAIVAKDLRQRLRDRSALLIAIVVPLALASIFGLTLRDVTSGDITFEYAVADLDRGDLGQGFRGLLREAEREGFVDVREARSEEEARALARDGDVSAAFVLPVGLTRAVAGGGPAELEVVGNVDAPIGSLVARSLADGFAGEVNAVRVAVAAAGGGPELAERASALPRPVRLEDVTTERKELDATTFYAAGMAVFFLFFTVQFGVASLFDERREGTLARLLAAPVPRGAIVAAKATTSIVLGVVSMTVLVVATSLLLGAEWGNPLGVGLLVVAGVLAATAVTTLVATVARTAEQAGTWLSIVALVLGMLGGSFFPVAQAGGALALLSRGTPHAWFLEGLAELTGGAGPAAVLPAVGAILVFAAAVGAFAYARIGRLVAP
ncbi:MAG: ABC transporter permease [Gaiellaceae bacterium]